MTIPAKPMTLYHYYRSSCSWRVRWALAFKNIRADLVAVNLLKDEQRQPWYLEKNPLGQVPCLELPGPLFFTESMAILEWLEEMYPQSPLLPQDPLSRLRVRGLCQMIISGTQPLQNLGAQRFFSADSREQQRYAVHWIKLGLAAYERQLLAQHTAGTYSFGQAVTLADLCVVPQCYNAERFGVQLADYPTLAGIYQRCLLTAACCESAPDRFQPAS